MIKEQSIKKILFFANLIGFLPNIAGALFVYFFMNYLNIFQLTTDVSLKYIMSKNYYLVILVFAVIVVLSFVLNRKRFGLTKKFASNNISPDEILELKRAIVNIPMVTTIFTFLGWFLAFAVYITTALFYNYSGTFLLLFFTIFLIGGSISFVAAFFLTDIFINKTISDIFPDGNFTGVKRAFVIPIYFRMALASWIGGLLPVILLFIFSRYYNILYNSRLITPELQLKFKALTLSILFLSIIMIIISTRYFANNISNPIVRLKNGMNMIAKSDFNIHIPVTNIDEMGELTGGFNVMVKGLKDREYIKDTFGKFVSANVRDEILNNKLELGGKRVEASVLFCDIRNFTTLSETIPADEVVDLLNIYFNEMVKPIMDNGGILDKFIGDALMAVFGPPSGLKNHAESAVRTAITMQEKLVAFNEIRKISNKIEISCGIGINSGDLIAGIIGSSERMEYTVIGDNVNIASRLEGLTRDYQTNIIISEATYSQIKQLKDIEMQYLGTVNVKGRTKPISIYSVNKEQINQVS